MCPKTRRGLGSTRLRRRRQARGRLRGSPGARCKSERSTCCEGWQSRAARSSATGHRAARPIRNFRQKAVRRSDSPGWWGRVWRLQSATCGGTSGGSPTSSLEFAARCGLLPAVCDVVAVPLPDAAQTMRRAPPGQCERSSAAGWRADGRWPRAAEFGRRWAEARIRDQGQVSRCMFGTRPTTSKDSRCACEGHVEGFERRSAGRARDPQNRRAAPVAHQLSSGSEPRSAPFDARNSEPPPLRTSDPLGGDPRIDL